MSSVRRRRRTLGWVLVLCTVLTVADVGSVAFWWTHRSEASAASTPSVAPAGPAAPASDTATAAAPDPSPSASSTAVTSPDGIPASEGPTAATSPASIDLAGTWRAPAGMPDTGRLVRVQIPGTRSHFPARSALLWLPPAALVPDPPALPVTVLLSGQSRGAGPDDLQVDGHLTTWMDGIAATHEGLAPIVVVPDQLTDGDHDPMCVDGPLGNSRTYLTEDVPTWVRAHLRVQTAPSAWTIGGFSQGGTCAIQLGAGDPALFGDLIDVSGEDGPTLGSVARTVREGFSGDRTAYLAAQPAALLRAHGPYRASHAFFAAGGADHQYGPVMPVMAARARAAGMTTEAWTVPRGRHSWTTAAAALSAGISWLMPVLRLAPA